MTKQILAAAVLVGLGVHASSANLILNGDFSSAATEDFQIELNDADQGWRTDVAGGGWDTGAGAAVARVLEEGIGQVVSVGAASGDQVTLSFDWTVAAGASASELNLGFYFLAWDVVGSPVVAADFFGNNNASALEGRHMVETLTGTAVALDIAANTLYPAVVGANGGAYGAGTQQEVLGTIGVTANFSETYTINNSSYGDIGDFDYIGVMFFQPQDSQAGSTLDNVSVTVIPEPATFGLLAIFGGALLALRRRRA